MSDEQLIAKKQLTSIVLVSFISFLGIALPYPILAPLFFADTNVLAIESYSISPSILFGITLAVYPLGQFFGSPILGSISDKIGRKPILLLSLFLSILGYLFSACALYYHSLLGLILSRLFTGLWEGNITIARAAAADISHIIPKAHTFGYLNGATSFGYVFGPLLGGFLSDDKIHPNFNHQLPFIVAAILSLFACWFIFVFFNETAKKTNAYKNKSMSINQALFGSFSLLNKKVIFHLISLSFLITISFDIYYQFFPLYLVKIWQFTEFKIAIVTALLAISMGGAQFFLIKPCKKYFSTEANITVMGILYALSLFSMLLFNDHRAIYILFPILGICIGIVGTFLPVYVSDHSSTADQGKIMGLLMSVRFLGDAFICILGGVIATYSLYAPFIGGVICILCGIIWFVRIPYLRLS